MSGKNLLLADSLHLSPRNFKSFLEFFEGRRVQVLHPTGQPLPIDAFGVYTGHADLLQRARGALERLDATGLRGAHRKGINLYEIARSELLAALIPQHPARFAQDIPLEEPALFDALLQNFRGPLLDNLAAALAWIDYWQQTLPATPRLSYVAVFSGSLIYARALLAVMKSHPARCFVLESFFTGRHYYCEERYTPIANNTDFRLPTVRRSLAPYIDLNTYEAKRNTVRNGLLQIANKNVTQPAATGRRVFDNRRPTLLLLGQVLNDFSLLDSAAGRICSLSAYAEMIRATLVQSDWNVIFKAHPWERKKANVRSPLTLEFLQAKFPGEERLQFVEDRALKDLFAECEAVACLNSQAGIEAALAGFKPFQFGGAFWGGNGFSADLPLGKTTELGHLLAASDTHGLSLAEFDSLERWLVTCVDRWLVEEASGPAAERRLHAIFHELPAEFAKASRAAGGLRGSGASSKILEPGHGTAATWASSLSRTARRWRKFFRRPREFFRDSRYGVIRAAGRLFAPARGW